MSKRNKMTRRFWVSTVLYDEKSRKFKVPSEWRVSDGLTVEERIEKCIQASRDFGDKIKSRFSEVNVGEASISGLYIEISMSEKEIKKLVEKIKSEFGCIVVDTADREKLIGAVR